MAFIGTQPIVKNTGSSSFPPDKTPEAIDVGKRAAGKRPTTVVTTKDFGGVQGSPGKKKIRPQRG